MHANFIVNPGRQASARDIERLIHHARETVRAKLGIELVPEVRIIVFGSRPASSHAASSVASIGSNSLASGCQSLFQTSAYRAARPKVSK